MRSLQWYKRGAAYVHQLVFRCPPVGLLVPVTWASAAHAMGIGSPCAGQLLPIEWAMSAQTLGLFLGNILLALCDV